MIIARGGVPESCLYDFELRVRAALTDAGIDDELRELLIENARTLCGVTVPEAAVLLRLWRS